MKLFTNLGKVVDKTLNTTIKVVKNVVVTTVTTVQQETSKKGGKK